MNNLQKLISITLITLAASIFAKESGVSFYHKNWMTVCDNTLTCRVAGYSKQAGTGGSVLFTRQAGANSTTTGEVLLAEDDPDKGTAAKKLALWIDGKSKGDLIAEENKKWRLSEQQALALIDAVKGSGKVEFKGGEQPFLLSSDGAYAALLKADDVQGRIGTPGAWVKKGAKPESDVAAAIPTPVITAVAVSKAQSRVLDKSEADALRPRLLAISSGATDCDYLNIVGEEDFNGNIINGEITVTPLDKTHTLISTLCWRAAYNEGYGFWLTDNTLNEKPVLVTEEAREYHNGIISNVFLGRSTGDCMTKEEWVWNGKTFQQSLAMTTGICWYLRPGGDWTIPSLVTDVKHKD